MCDEVGVACRYCSNYIFILDLASIDWAKKTAGQYERQVGFGIWYPYIRPVMVLNVSNIIIDAAVKDEISMILLS